MRRTVPAVCVLTLALTGVGAAVAGPSGPSGPGGSGGSGGSLARVGQVLAGSLRGVPDRGPVTPGRVLSIGVALRHPDPAGEERAVAEVTDPTGPDYRRFWSVPQWQQRFGPAGRVVADARRWLTRDGLRVTWASYDYLLLSGTSAQVDRTFDVRLREYRRGVSGAFYGSARAALAPGYVGAVLGLDERERFHVGSPGQDLCAPNVACLGGLTPRDLWSIYGLPDRVTGHGQRVGVLGQGAWTGALADLRTFEKAQKLPRVNVRVVPINNPNTDTANRVEWDIDTQASTGMAPGVDELVLYFASSLAGADMTAAMTGWANDPDGPNQVDASFGGCESINLALNEIGAEEPIFRQAAAEGRTLFVSSGDTGGSCTVVTGNGVANTGVPQVSWPASSPHVTSVGGTQLYSDGATPARRVLEKAWEYTGGGTSYVMPAPDWQRKIAVIAGRCTVGIDGNPQPPGTVCRGVPDVAAVSGDIATNGYTIINNGQNGSGGGTSLSSPLWVGMWARIQAGAPLVGGRPAGLGFAAPLLYQRAFAATPNAPDFVDIAIGSNGQYPAIAANPADPTGWDYVSGLGAPIVQELLLHLTGRIRETVPKPAPSRPDRVVALGKFGCRADGSVTDPSGDVFGVGAADADVTELTVTSRHGVVTFTLTIPGLASNPDLLLHTTHFSFDGADYDVQAERLPGAGTAYFLDKDAGGTQTMLGNLDGAFDLSAHQVRVVMDARSFNGLAKPAHDLRAGSTLAIGNVFTTADVFTDDTVVSPGCPYRVR